MPYARPRQNVDITAMSRLLSKDGIKFANLLPVRLIVDTVSRLGF
jgi:hypothetical protein